MADQKTLVRGADGDTLGTAAIGTTDATTVIQMPIWQMVAVRVVRNYLQVVLGLLAADGVGAVELAHAGNDFWIHLLAAAKIALAPAVIALLHNSVEFLTKLDVNNPEWRA